MRTSPDDIDCHLRPFGWCRPEEEKKCSGCKEDRSMVKIRQNNGRKNSGLFLADISSIFPLLFFCHLERKLNFNFITFSFFFHARSLPLLLLDPFITVRQQRRRRLLGRNGEKEKTLTSKKFIQLSTTHSSSFLFFSSFHSWNTSKYWKYTQTAVKATSVVRNFFHFILN